MIILRWFLGQRPAFRSLAETLALKRRRMFSGKERPRQLGKSYRNEHQRRLALSQWSIVSRFLRQRHGKSNSVPDDMRERILRNLTGVGPAKPIGYLPLYTIGDVLGADPARLAAQARTRGLSAIVLAADHCCIKSGALYVYDRAALRRLLRDSASHVQRSGLSGQPDRFIKQIALRWFKPDDPIFPVIRAAFGETSSRLVPS